MRVADSTPVPISTAFTACNDITACASNPSRRSSHWAKVPSPGGTLWATTSNTPPMESPVRSAWSTSAFMRCSESGSAQLRRLPVWHATPEVFPMALPHLPGWPCPRRSRGSALQCQVPVKKFGNSANGDAGSGFTGGSASKNVAGFREVVFQRAGEIGVAGTW